MDGSLHCPACDRPETFDEVCPTCGRNLATQPGSALGPKLVASIYARAEQEWRLASQTYSLLSLSLSKFTEKVSRVAKRCVESVATDAVPPAQAVTQLLDSLNWADLFLTTACAEGDTRAWEAFQKRYRPVIHSTALKASTSASEAAELSDTLLTDLFLPTEGGLREAKIAQYHGLGSLEGWIRVVVHRMAIDQIRLHRKNVSMEELDAELPSVSSHGRADESIAERDADRARGMVSECLAVALEKLSPQERLVLSLYYPNYAPNQPFGLVLGA